MAAMLLLGLLALLCPDASAQALRAVPPGVSAITVMLCDQPDGCAASYQALADHCAGLGLPLLDFDDLVQAGPGGGDARAALDEALISLAERPELVREAMRATPLTLPPEQPFFAWLHLGIVQHAAGELDAAEASFTNAASTSGGRVHDLPEMPTEALDLYLDVASRDRGRGSLRIEADVRGAAVFVDGRLQGEAPLEVELSAGWHRVSVERTGRRTAWVGEVQLPAGRTLGLLAEVDADDAPATLEAAVQGAIAGRSVPPELARRLADQAHAQGLQRVRFVSLSAPKASGQVPEERIEGKTGLWDVHATWLDVGSARFSALGPGPATLRASADPERFTLGLSLGYTRLQSRLPSGPDPHDHIGVEATGLVALRPGLALDGRVGLWRSAQPYYLYDTWLSRELIPVALGARWTHKSGVHLGAQALAVVPIAIGGQLISGWTWRPSTRWRVGIEAKGGYTDEGAVIGGGLGAGFAG